MSSSTESPYPPNCYTSGRLTPIESCSDFPPTEAAPAVVERDTDMDASADANADADASGGITPPIWENCLEHDIFCEVDSKAVSNTDASANTNDNAEPAIEADVTANAEENKNLPHGWGPNHIPIPHRKPKPHHKPPFSAGNWGGKPPLAADVAEPDTTPTLVEREEEVAAAETPLVPVHCDPDNAQHCVPHPPAIVAELADQSSDNDNQHNKSKRDIIVSGQNLECITFRSPPSRALAELCSPVGTGLEVTALSRMICGLMIDHSSGPEPTLAGRCVPTLQDLSPQAQEKGLACSGVRDPVSNVVFDLCVKAGEKLKVNDEGSVCGWNWSPVNGDLFEKCVNVREPTVHKRDDSSHSGQEDPMAFTKRWDCAVFLALLAFGGVLVYLAGRKWKKAVRGPSEEFGEMDCLPK